MVIRMTCASVLVVVLCAVGLVPVTVRGQAPDDGRSDTDLDLDLSLVGTDTGNGSYDVDVSSNGTGIPERQSSFADSLFTMYALRHGAVILHMIAALYCFIMIGIICEDYFLPAVDCICSDLNLSQDVAAATFMSFATTAPELFVILIATFLTNSDIGLGAVVGSGMFNILGVATVGGLAAKKSIKLDWWPFFRDSIAYMVSVGLLAVVLSDGKVTLLESLYLIGYYFVYFLIMVYNRRIRKKIKKCMKSVKAKSQPKKEVSTDVTSDKSSQPPAINVPAINIVLDDSNVKESQSKQSSPKENRKENEEGITTTRSDTGKEGEKDDEDEGDTMFKAYFVHYEDCISLRRISLSSSRRVSIDRGSMTDRRKSMSLRERKRSVLHQKRGSQPSVKFQTDSLHDVAVKVPDTVEEKSPDELVAVQEEETKDDQEQTFRSIFCTFPVDSFWSKLHWLLVWPIAFVFYWTIPDARTEKWKRFYPITFLMCVFWIGSVSYFGTWMIEDIGIVFGVSDAVMGLTILALGGSMPEAISTYIMARQGEGGLGFSNSLGGNTMDICLCLGLPWLVKCISKGSVKIYSEDMEYNTLALLMGIVILLSVGIFTKFHMNRKMGFICCIFYAVYIVVSVLIELKYIQLKK